MMTLTRRVCVLLLISVPSVPVAAEALSLGASRDNTLFQTADGGLSNGVGQHMFSGLTVGFGLRRAVIGFDLSSVPASATINAATLTLNVSAFRTPVSISLHRATANWGEGTSNSDPFGPGGGAGAPSTTGDATWLHSVYSDTLWTQPGGDFAASASSSATFSDVGPFSLPSTPQMVADVQDWISAPTTNFGWFIMAPQSPAISAVRFSTRENSDTAARPRLIIDYSIISSSTWLATGGGNWNDSPNWNGGVPNGPGAQATFGNSILAPSTVTLAGPVSVGSLTFNHLQSYTLGGSGPLQMDHGSLTAATLDVLQGSHTIGVPLSLLSNTVVNVGPASSTLTVSGAMTAAPGAMLVKSGAGAARFRHVRAGALQLDSGKVAVLPGGGMDGASLVGSLSIAGSANAWTAQLDLANNAMMIQSPSADLENQILSGFSGGSFGGSGITTSLGDASHRLGYAQASDLGLFSFLGQGLSEGALLIQYALAGDANLDGSVNKSDLTRLAINWQGSGGWYDGDFDYNGIVDLRDLWLLSNNWLQDINLPPLSAELENLGLPANVPEPIIPLVAGVFMIFARSWPGRRRVRTA